MSGLAVCLSTLLNFIYSATDKSAGFKGEDRAAKKRRGFFSLAVFSVVSYMFVTYNLRFGVCRDAIKTCNTVKPTPHIRSVLD